MSGHTPKGEPSRRAQAVPKRTTELQGGRANTLQEAEY